jgi:hypothetical protein
MYMYVNDFDTVELHLYSVVTLKLDSVKHYGLLSINMLSFLLFLIQTMYMYTPVALYRFKNKDILRREICTLSSLMRVSKEVDDLCGFPFYMN